MDFTWKYPLFLVPMHGGYASVVDSSGEGDPVHFLAVFQDEQTASAFMHVCLILGQPRPLHNAREFCWLLQSLRDPVTHVAFDPEPDVPHVSARQQLSVRDLLQHHLVVDYSPWTYPIYAIAQAQGYASIDGISQDGQPWTAVIVFSDRDKAEAYLRDSGGEGSVEALVDLDQTRTFLQDLAGAVTAVALDAVIDHGRSSAKHCFSVQSLLEKYLVKVR